MWEFFSKVQSMLNDFLANDQKVLAMAQRYDYGDMRAVLTKDNFSSIDISSWKAEERQRFLEFTNKSLEQARACLVLLAQFGPDKDREALLEKIGTNADLLWRTYSAASSAAPMQYIQDIDLRQRCSNVFKPNNKTP